MWAAAAVVAAALRGLVVVAVVALREPVVLAVVALRALVVLAAGPVVLVVPVRRLVQVDPLRALVVLAVLVVLVHRLVRADRHPLRVLAAPVAPAVHLVLEAAVPLRRLLSPQSCSVAMAWSSPPRVKPSSSPVRKSR